MLCFTYLQAMPQLVEFLFTYGFQSTAQDPYFSSFFQRTCLSAPSSALTIPELAWSGFEIQMCYNLKSMERTGSEPTDWSMRSCVVHHTFDIKSVRASWIIIKGNGSIRDRIEQATNNDDTMSSYETLAKAFAASLVTHLLFCDWVCTFWSASFLPCRVLEAPDRSLSIAEEKHLQMIASRFWKGQC